MKSRVFPLFSLFSAILWLGIGLASLAEPFSLEQQALQQKATESSVIVLLDHVGLSVEQSAALAEQWLKDARYRTELTPIRHQARWVLETDFLVYRSAEGQWPGTLLLKGPARDAARQLIRPAVTKQVTPAEALSAIQEIEARLLPDRVMHDYAIVGNPHGRAQPTLMLEAIQKCPHTGLPVQETTRRFQLETETGLIFSVNDSTLDDVPDLGRVQVSREDAFLLVDQWMNDNQPGAQQRRRSAKLLVTDFLLSRQWEKDQLGPYSLEHKWRLVWVVEMNYLLPRQDGLATGVSRTLTLDAQSGKLLSAGH